MIITNPIIPSLPSALQILSAMITPAVLILACGSLVMTTSSRLIRCVDRVRQITVDLDEFDATDPSDDARYEMLRYQLERTAVRARVMLIVESRLAWR